MTTPPTPAIVPHADLQDDEDYLLFLVDCNDPQYRSCHGVVRGCTAKHMVLTSLLPACLEFQVAR